MFLRLLLLVIGVSLSLQLQAQKLISHTLINHYTENELEGMWKENKISQWIVPINNGIKMYEIIYTTSWHDGSKIKASGLVFIPDDFGIAYITLLQFLVEIKLGQTSTWTI